jgi:glycosyltransferase involved in cell wall biosynthesis
MTLKIAVIGTRGLPATYGGIEKHCEELFSALVEAGYKVTVYSRNYYTELEEFKGIKIKRLFVPNIRGFETFLYSFIASMHAAFTDADIIHYHAQGPALFSWIPRLLSPRKKIGFTCHGIDWQRDKWNFIAKLIIQLGEKASVRFPHIKIGVSQSLVDYYKYKYKIPLQKIPNGIKLNEKKPLIKLREKFGLEENGYFLFVGRLVPEKGIDILINAFKLANTLKKLVIVGDSAGTDDYVNKLKFFAKDDKRIIFTSYLFGEDLIEIFSNSLAYISASKLEGLPLTVLEAMSFARPLILSDIPPHIEQISHNNKCAFIFKTENIKDCKEKIEQFLNKSDKDVLLMGNISQNIVKKHFSWKTAVDETKKLYINSFN